MFASSNLIRATLAAGYVADAAEVRKIAKYAEFGQCLVLVQYIYISIIYIYYIYIVYIVLAYSISTNASSCQEVRRHGENDDPII